MTLLCCNRRQFAEERRAPQTRPLVLNFLWRRMQDLGPKTEKEEFPGPWEGLAPGNSLPQICVVSEYKSGQFRPIADGQFCSIVRLRKQYEPK